jgi:hypothetical protein
MHERKTEGDNVPLLAPLDLYVRHTSPVMNAIFRRIVKFLEPTRHDPVLRRFPNAHEL